MKDLWSENRKAVNSFIAICVIIVSFMLIAMGIFAASNNTRMIESGITPAMIYAQRENSQISVNIGERLFSSNQKEIPLNDLAHLAPAPLNGIYIIYENISKLMN